MKKTLAPAILAATATLLLVGCAATPVSPQAAKVLVSPNAAPQGCHYLGQIVGNQGNFFTGGFTSNKNLQVGAMNDLKNQAGQMGANYVQLVANVAGSTGSMSDGSGGMQQTNITATGNAYKCPAAAIDE